MWKVYSLVCYLQRESICDNEVQPQHEYDCMSYSVGGNQYFQ
jgi:hypothetical protein